MAVCFVLASTVTCLFHMYLGFFCSLGWSNHNGRHEQKLWFSKKTTTIYWISFYLFEWFKKFWAQKHTPLPNQPANQPNNQSRWASCMTTGDCNKRRTLCCVCIGRSLCDLVCLLQSTRWCHSHYLLQTLTCRHIHACVRTQAHTHARTHTHFLSLANIFHCYEV